MPMHDWTRVAAEVAADFRIGWLVAVNRALNRGVLPATHYALIEPATATGRAEVHDLRPPGPDADPPATAGGAPACPGGSIERAARRRPRSRSRLVVRRVADHRAAAVVEIAAPDTAVTRRAARAFVDKSVGLLMAGVHVLIVNPFAPGAICRAGLHPPVWNRVARRRKGTPEYAPPAGKTLEALSYASGDDVTAVVQPFAVGDPVPAAPLFLATDWHVTVPLDGAYTAAFAEVPAVWRAALGG